MAFNMAMIVLPGNLSYDWQTGSIPLITSVQDPRNLLTVVFVAVLLLLLCKCRSLIFDVLYWCSSIARLPVCVTNAAACRSIRGQASEDGEEVRR